MTAIYVKESPQSALENGVELQYSLDWEDTVTDASTTVSVFLASTKENISTDVLSGSNSDTGNISTFQKITTQANHGGDKYIVVFDATVGGIADRRKLIINIDEEDAQ
jgi:hypothetical protein